MASYERLRKALTDPEATGKKLESLFVRMATGMSGVTAAIVTAAALDVPRERAAQLIGREPSEVDALVTLYDAEVERQIAQAQADRSEPAA